jgi:hypothetical protein
MAEDAVAYGDGVTEVFRNPANAIMTFGALRNVKQRARAYARAGVSLEGISIARNVDPGWLRFSAGNEGCRLCG